MINGLVLRTKNERLVVLGRVCLFLPIVYCLFSGIRSALFRTGGADRAKGIFGFCRTRIDSGPAFGPSLKKALCRTCPEVGRRTKKSPFVVIMFINIPLMKYMFFLFCLRGEYYNNRLLIFYSFSSFQFLSVIFFIHPRALKTQTASPFKSSILPESMK